MACQQRNGFYQSPFLKFEAAQIVSYSSWYYPLGR